ncbi:MAG: pyruvate, phosphate dikinase [Fimbriimonadales bacterium]|nr:pyruvate, phosphate dikinase [Fimbriimonadales bacterium]
MKRVYLFEEGRADMRDLLGGKGANLAEMTNIGLPVPPGFTITTDVCRGYMKRLRLPDGLMQEVREKMQIVEGRVGKKFGDPNNPLLVSVRSGAKFSMPGMMDTILNLGLNDTTAAGMVKLTKNPRFVYDAYRRFVMMFSDVVMDIPKRLFEERFEALKHRLGVKQDTEVPADALKELVSEFKQLVRDQGKEFPEDPYQQLEMAIEAVFRSWNNERAVIYREREKIPHDLGTACNVQAMVFGNMGDDSGTGVAFTRDPSTGERELYGEFLPNAQGEDVVAGVRTPLPLSALHDRMPEVYQQFLEIADRLERHYRDMMDLEFTVERGRLWMLQCRVGKRTGRAAVKIAVDMAQEGLIGRDEAILRVQPSHLDQLLHPHLDERALATGEYPLLAQGLGASPGAASGRAVFDSKRAMEQGKHEPVILVRPETNPDDVGGMLASKGILTARGGMTCIAGETRILTDRGFLTAEQAFELFADEVPLKILSFDTTSLRPVWRPIIAAGRRPEKVVRAQVSQTGRSKNNWFRITPDHKMFVIRERQLVKVPLHEVAQNGEYLVVLDGIPPLGETHYSPAFAYVLGALLSDGYICLTRTKGYVVFVQKPTPEKAEFIQRVRQAFEEAFGYSMRPVRLRRGSGVLRGRIIEGEVADHICFRKEPAARLSEVAENIVKWILQADEESLRHFLAGYIDGDGSYSAKSSKVRVQIVVSHRKPQLLEALVLACLRLGILPQVTNNRESHLVQITEGVEQLLACSSRLRAVPPSRRYASKCFSMRALCSDIVEEVNYHGRVREAVKRNIMFGADKIQRDILPLCKQEETRKAMAKLLNAPIRSYRVSVAPEEEETLVYNFEVDAEHELDKNYIIFSSQLTPVLVSNSHAAVVARGFGIPCVAGCEAISVDEYENLFTVEFDGSALTVREGDYISIDGSTGKVYKGAVPTVEPELSPELHTLLKWADEFRRLRIRANADNPHDAAKALEFGAEGIGLARTEHMFFGEQRLPIMQEMILAKTEKERRDALSRLLPFQRQDFFEIFEVMRGLPVTIRLIDPPLHEFLPRYEDLIREVAQLEITAPDSAELAEKRRLLQRVEELHEANPMLGLRGVRLSLLYPEIVEMQVTAILEAAAEASRRGYDPHVEIMIPLVGHVNELRLAREHLERVAKEVMEGEGVRVDYKFGTMIEIPRAALTADEIAQYAQFFSFGTNDLTQTTFGYSRDDAEGKFLAYYVEHKILPENPFVTLDRDGVGKLIRMAFDMGRAVRPDLKVGICGEHGGDPDSIAFCHEVGLDYVSCSPFRVPIARLAAAQAALRKRVQIAVDK